MRAQPWIWCCHHHWFLPWPLACAWSMLGPGFSFWRWFYPAHRTVAKSKWHNLYKAPSAVLEHRRVPEMVLAPPPHHLFSSLPLDFLIFFSFLPNRLASSNVSTRKWWREQMDRLLQKMGQETPKLPSKKLPPALLWICSLPWEVPWPSYFHPSQAWGEEHSNWGKLASGCFLSSGGCSVFEQST